MKIIPHGPIYPLRGTGRQYCINCGLVYLHNDITEAAIKYGCEHEKHPGFIAVEKKIRNEIQQTLRTVR